MNLNRAVRLNSALGASRGEEDASLLATREPQFAAAEIGQPRQIPTILRLSGVKAQTGYSRSTIYLRISQGLWPYPLRLGTRSVGWPASEVAAINSARIAGRTDDEIRDLVVRLQAARKGYSR